MNERRRDRLAEQTARDAREALAKAADAARRDEFTHAVLTGTSTRLIALAAGVCFVATFAAAALALAIFGGG